MPTKKKVVSPVAKSKAAKTPAVKKAKAKAPEHPLMLDGKHWNRAKTVDFICACIATSTIGIVHILAKGYQGYNLPDYTTFMLWLREDDDISHQYAIAKEDQADFMADEMMDIADNDVADPVLVDGLPLMVNGVPVMARSQVAVAHARLRVDTRKWLASKLKPKKYGDRTTLAGDSENPLAVLTMDQITSNQNSRIKVK